MSATERRRAIDSSYKLAQDKVYTRWGKQVRENVGEVLFKALIAEALFYQLTTQDDSIDPAVIVDMMHGFHDRLIEED